MSDINRIEDLLYEGFQPPPSGVAFKLKEILSTFKHAEEYLNPESKVGSMIDPNEAGSTARQQLLTGISQLEAAIRSLENLNR